MTLSSWLNSIVLPDSIAEEDSCDDALDRVREAIAVKEVFAKELGWQLGRTVRERHQRELRQNLLLGAGETANGIGDYSFGKPQLATESRLAEPVDRCYRRILLFWAFTNFRLAAHSARGREMQKELQSRVQRTCEARNDALRALQVRDMERSLTSHSADQKVATLAPAADISGEAIHKIESSSGSWDALFQRARAECENRKRGFHSLAGGREPSELLAEPVQCSNAEGCLADAERRQQMIPDRGRDAGRERPVESRQCSPAIAPAPRHGIAPCSPRHTMTQECASRLVQYRLHVVLTMERTQLRTFILRVFSAWRLLVTNEKRASAELYAASMRVSSKALDLSRATRFLDLESASHTHGLLLWLFSSWSKFATSRRHRTWLLATAIAGMHRGETLLFLQHLVARWHRLADRQGGRRCFARSSALVLQSLFIKEDRALLAELLLRWRMKSQTSTASSVARRLRRSDHGQGVIEQSSTRSPMSSPSKSDVVLIEAPYSTAASLHQQESPADSLHTEVATALSGRRKRKLLLEFFAAWARLAQPWKEQSMSSNSAPALALVSEGTGRDRDSSALERRCSRLEAELFSTRRIVLDSERERSILLQQLLASQSQAQTTRADTDAVVAQPALLLSQENTSPRHRRKSPQSAASASPMAARPSNARRVGDSSTSGRIGISAFVDPKTQHCNWEGFLAALQGDGVVVETKTVRVRR
mmetsp:Transcript_49498/g.117817  ORF Transcript_49498/g.117817 Transcript_49498/m.117817 type:complete len:709 (-) Transcript_49498:92-2218(-)